MSEIKKTQSCGTSESLYPNCELLSAYSKDRSAVLRFFEWLDEKGIYLATMDKFGYFDGVRKSVDNLFMDSIGIDRKQLEKERQAMLEAQRKANEK